MPTLREKMKREMVLIGLTESTQAIYLKTITRLHDYYNKRSPSHLSEEEITAYLFYLKQEKKMAPNTYNTQVYGLRFFYCITLRRPLYKWFLRSTKVTYKLPEILSPNEVAQIIKAAGNLKYRTLLMLIYSSGLRVSEAVKLRVSDIDSQRMTLHIRDAKGHKDRYVMLSPVMDQALRAYWKVCRFSNYVFPSKDNPDKAISIGMASQKFKAAKTKAGITKKGGIHSLRHGFATHMLESGVDIFAIKSLLGHSSIQSTVRYLDFVPNRHQNIVSPLDRLAL